MIIVRLLSPSLFGWLVPPKFTQSWEPTLSWNQLHALTFRGPAPIRATDQPVAHGAAGRARMLSILPATFVAPERGVSHDSGNATVRIPMLREDRDRDRPILYCSHCRLDTEAGKSFFRVSSRGWRKK